VLNRFDTRIVEHQVLGQKQCEIRDLEPLHVYHILYDIWAMEYSFRASIISRCDRIPRWILLAHFIRYPYVLGFCQFSSPAPTPLCPSSTPYRVIGVIVFIIFRPLPSMLVVPKTFGEK
jgi:hypothetical protein